MNSHSQAAVTSFFDAYTDGEPVEVRLPDGSTRIVLGFVLRDNGISWMDDACLEEMPTRHADHHLHGTSKFENGMIELEGHRFSAVEDFERALAWRRMMKGRDVRVLRKHAEARLVQLRR